jgi:hypothetical protein
MNEPRIIVLGVLDTTDYDATAISISPDMDPSEIQAAILRANAERAAAAKRESEHLQNLFLKGDGAQEVLPND